MNKIRVAVKAIILKDNDILLIRRTINKENDKVRWDIPGGGIEWKETYEQALSREVMEEVGLKVQIKDIIRAWSYSEKEDEMLYGVTYLAEYISGKVELSDEHEEYKWVDLNLCHSLDIDSWIKEEAAIVAKKLRNL